MRTTINLLMLSGQFCVEFSIEKPMNGNTIAFPLRISPQKSKRTNGAIRNWNEIVRSPENNHHH
jgi:hypothetical protein